MINLISVSGKTGSNFYLGPQYTADFKSLVNCITSGRVMIVSTRYRSDLIYTSEKPRNNSILKLWALYANTTLPSLNRKDFSTAIGDKQSFTKYFQSIMALSNNWHHYDLYRKAFRTTFCADQDNPVTQMVITCDQYLTQQDNITREPLVDINEKIISTLTKDTFSLAMDLLNNETHVN